MSTNFPTFIKICMLSSFQNLKDTLVLGRPILEQAEIRGNHAQR